MSSDHDVVVTGIGATTPIGGTAPETWQAMLDGKVGVKNINEPWVEKFELPVNLHAPLAVDPLEVLPRVEARRLDRSQQVALIAAREAWADAGSPDDIDPLRRGTVIGTGIGGAVTLHLQGCRSCARAHRAIRLRRRVAALVPIGLLVRTHGLRDRLRDLIAFNPAWEAQVGAAKMCTAACLTLGAGATVAAPTVTVVAPIVAQTTAVPMRTGLAVALKVLPAESFASR